MGDLTVGDRPHGMPRPQENERDGCPVGVSEAVGDVPAVKAGVDGDSCVGRSVAANPKSRPCICLTLALTASV